MVCYIPSHFIKISVLLNLFDNSDMLYIRNKFVDTIKSNIYPGLMEKCMKIQDICAY